MLHCGDFICTCIYDFLSCFLVLQSCLERYSFSVVMLLVNGIFVQYTLNKKIIYSKAFHLERIKNVRTPQFRDFLKGALEEVERIKSPKVNIQPSVFLPSLPYSSSHFRFLSD